MGLWIKNDDGSIEKVAGSGGGGGSFDGEHVLTGDVDNPPEELAVGQLMWDGVEGSSGGSGGGSFDGEHVPTGDPTDPAMFEALDVGQLLYDGVEDTGGAATELTQQIVKFDTAGTFEFKKADYPNLAFVNVEAIGGGGAGGTAPANPAGENKASVAAGGGSGGYAFRTLMASDLADVESVVVGAGGTGSLTRSMVDGVETAGVGGDGGPSLAFGINVHGGAGGHSVQTSGGGDYLVARPGLGGGVYGVKDYGVRGGAGFAPDAQVQRSMGGNGGGVMFAVGGSGGNAVTATGQGGGNGHNGGGGGGGANRANSDAVQIGGAGGDGIVVVTVFSVTGSGGGGVVGGPHDHDYLPLAGGTLTGDLTVDGTLTAETNVWFTGGTTGEIVQSKTSGRSILVAKPDATGNGPQLQLLGDSDPSNDAMAFKDASGNYLFRQQKGGLFWAYGDLRVNGDLQVDGNANITINAPSDYWRGRKAGTIFHEYGGIVSQGSFSTALNSNGYRNGAGTWTNMGHGLGATVVELYPTGAMHVRVASDYPTGSGAQVPSRFQVTESGPTFRAMPSKTRTVDDVLERAETAEFPPEDDEGVATMDGYDEVPLFEVVSALLAKVKELSARIEELEGA